MKKLFVFILSLALALSLVACTPTQEDARGHRHTRDHRTGGHQRTRGNRAAGDAGASRTQRPHRGPRTGANRNTGPGACSAARPGDTCHSR